MILVDTPVWLLALRRRTGDVSGSDRKFTQALSDLVRQKRIQMVGSIRQELLSGIREESQFRLIRDYLRDFPEVSLDSGDYEEAARISNQCRRSGISSSPVDMLACAVALRHRWEIFTTDRDFIHYARVIPIRMFSAA